MKDRQAYSGVRLLVLMLLLANVAFLAWSQHLSSLLGVSPEGHLLQQQINPDAIRLLPPEPAAAAGTAQADASSEAPAATAAAAVPTACFEWGAFAPADVRGAEGLLAKLLPEAKASQRRVMDESGTWWVFIPPQGSRQGAQQKAGELRRLGVDELFIVQEDTKYRFAVSLGVFRTQEAARNRLEQLRAQGVRTAQVAPRDTSSQHVFVQMRGPADPLRAAQDALRQEFPGTDIKACAPGSRS